MGHWEIIVPMLNVKMSCLLSFIPSHCLDLSIHHLFDLTGGSGKDYEKFLASYDGFIYIQTHTRMSKLWSNFKAGNECQKLESSVSCDQAKLNIYNPVMSVYPVICFVFFCHMFSPQNLSHQHNSLVQI